MRIDRRWYLAITGAFLFLGVGITARADDETTVRWDIIHIKFGAPGSPNTISAGGVAFAATRNPSSLKIELTGSGTFKPGEPEEVTGGGTWMTFSGCPSACVPTGSGTFKVTKLVSWQFDNLQLPVNIDLIGPNAANGNAVLRIRYSDGSSGILGLGCHGPGADDGIHEGVIATKHFKTYWDSADTVPGVDANRTAFHILAQNED